MIRTFLGAVDMIEIPYHEKKNPPKTDNSAIHIYHFLVYLPNAHTCIRSYLLLHRLLLKDANRTS